MSNSFYDALLGATGELEHPDAYGTDWYVMDPSTGMTQSVTADAHERYGRPAPSAPGTGPRPQIRS